MDSDSGGRSEERKDGCNERGASAALAPHFQQGISRTEKEHKVSSVDLLPKSGYRHIHELQALEFLHLCTVIPSDMELQAMVERLRGGKALEFPTDANTLAFAQNLDSQDSLRHLRDEFIIPTKGSFKKKALDGSIPGIDSTP